MNMKRRLFIFLMLSLLALPLQITMAQEPEIGQTIQIMGTADIVSPNVFRLIRPYPYGNGVDYLVVPENGESFNIDVNNGMRVSVVGEVDLFSVPDLEAELNTNLDDDQLAAYDVTDYVIKASSVEDTTAWLTTVETIAQTPDIYYERPVTITGVVTEMASDNWYLLADTELDAVQERVLVVSRDPAGFTYVPIEGARVQVTGEVVPFVLDEIEANVGYEFEVDPMIDYVGPAILTGAPYEETLTSATLEDVTTDPVSYYGMTVTVRGEVEEIYDNFSMLVEDGEWYDLDEEDLLAVSRIDMGIGDLEEGDEIEMTGTVQDFVLVDLETTYDLDLLDEELGAYAGPVLVLDNLVLESEVGPIEGFLD